MKIIKTFTKAMGVITKNERFATIFIYTRRFIIVPVPFNKIKIIFVQDT